MADSPSQPIQWAGAPFDKTKSDTVILRSSDGVHFRVRKSILEDASIIFEDIFTNAQPAGSATLKTEDEEVEGLSVVGMEESSKVLDCLLRLYYTSFTTTVATPAAELEDICGAIIAGRKYFMTYAETELKKLFASRSVEEDAVAAYAAACHYDLKEEIRLAAKASLLWSANFAERENLSMASGSQIFKLLRYRERCAYAACQATAPRALLNVSQITRDASEGDDTWPEPTTHLLSGGWMRSDAKSTEFPAYLKAMHAALHERPHPDAIYAKELQGRLRYVVYSDADESNPGGYGDEVCTESRPDLDGDSFMYWQDAMEMFESGLAKRIERAIAMVDFDTV